MKMFATQEESKNMWKRILRVMFFPVTVFLWMIGWCLYYVGNKQDRNKPGKSRIAPKRDPLEIIAVVNEEMLIATDESE